jgi:hypothetical protein
MLSRPIPFLYVDHGINTGKNSEYIVGPILALLTGKIGNIFEMIGIFPPLDAFEKFL